MTSDFTPEVESGNMAISCMRNASVDNYRNSSFIVDEAMGQIAYNVSRNAFSSFSMESLNCV